MAIAEDIRKSPAFAVLRSPFEIWVARCMWNVQGMPYRLPPSVAVSESDIALALKQAGKPYGKEAVRTELETRMQASNARVQRAKQAIMLGWDDEEVRTFVCSEEEYERARREAASASSGYGSRVPPKPVQSSMVI